MRKQAEPKSIIFTVPLPCSTRIFSSCGFVKNMLTKKANLFLLGVFSKEGFDALNVRPDTVEFGINIGDSFGTLGGRGAKTY